MLVTVHDVRDHVGHCFKDDFLNSLSTKWTLKGVCHEIFDPYFFFMIRTHLGLKFGFDFAEIFDHKLISAVCIIYRGDISVHTTETILEEINCTPRKQNRILHLSVVAFKETIRRNPFRGEHIYHERKDLKYKMLIY